MLLHRRVHSYTCTHYHISLLYYHDYCILCQAQKYKWTHENECPLKNITTYICINIYSQIKHETELKPTLHIGWIQETFLSFSHVFSGVCGMYSSGCEALSCRQHFILSNSCAAERQPRKSLSHKVSRCVKTSVQKKCQWQWVSLKH